MIESHHRINMQKIARQLRELHDAHGLGLNRSVYGTDKLLYKSYLECFYPQLLAGMEVPKILVEIGVRGGASLHLWSLFLPETAIHGVDLIGIGEQDGPNPDFMRRPNISFKKGEAYTTEMAAALPDEIDLLIEDGSHFIADQILTVRLYGPKLSAAGVLVIEDVQRAYLDAWRILRTIDPGQYRIGVQDLRLNKAAYDDFLITISKGQTPFLRRLHYTLRVATFPFEHLAIKVLHRFRGTKPTK